VAIKRNEEIAREKRFRDKAPNAAPHPLGIAGHQLAPIALTFEIIDCPALLARLCLNDVPTLGTLVGKKPGSG
jgi:hypothetical protein